MNRILARDWQMWRRNKGAEWRFDGHDNNWLLLEFVLAIPFVAGFKMGIVSPLLALTCALEAITCWPFWNYWRNW